MKKIFFFVAVMFAAVAMNAAEVVVDLSKYALIKSDGATVTPALNAGVLKVDYTTTKAWDDIAGVSFALDNLKVTKIAFEFIGDAALSPWTSFLVYLEDANGAKWINSAADLHINGWEGDWSAQSYMPADELWGDTEHPSTQADKFVSLGFMINSGTNATSTFSIKNVKLTVAGGTNIDNTAIEAQTTKLIRDGQLVIIRNGVEYNAAGQMK